MVKISGIENYADFHIWTLKGHKRICSIKIIRESAEISCYTLKNKVKGVLGESGITYSVIEIADEIEE